MRARNIAAVPQRFGERRRKLASFFLPRRHNASSFFPFIRSGDRQLESKRLPVKCDHLAAAGHFHRGGARLSALANAVPEYPVWSQGMKR